MYRENGIARFGTSGPLAADWLSCLVGLRSHPCGSGGPCECGGTCNKGAGARRPAAASAQNAHRQSPRPRAMPGRRPVPASQSMPAQRSTPPQRPMAPEPSMPVARPMSVTKSMPHPQFMPGTMATPPRRPMQSNRFASTAKGTMPNRATTHATATTRRAEASYDVHNRRMPETVPRRPQPQRITLETTRMQQRAATSRRSQPNRRFTPSAPDIGAAQQQRRFVDHAAPNRRVRSRHHVWTSQPIPTWVPTAGGDFFPRGDWFIQWFGSDSNQPIRTPSCYEGAALPCGADGFGGSCVPAG